jgi:hypothetical protein
MLLGMAFPGPHMLLVIGGKLGAAEDWTMSLRIGEFDAQTAAQETAAMGVLKTFIGTHWARSDIPISQGAKLGYIKYNQIGPDGKYVRSATNVSDYTPPIVGSNISPIYPFQVSLVATLETSVNRGLASKGRIFLPCPKYPSIGQNMTLDPANAALAAKWVADLITGINNSAGVGTVVVGSNGFSEKVPDRPGVFRNVTGVNVGTVFDTMRSRRHKLIEERPRAATAGFAGSPGN